MADEPQNEVQPVEFPDHGSEVSGTDGVEVIVHDKDEDGNVVGWHKEVKEDN